MISKLVAVFAVINFIVPARCALQRANQDYWVNLDQDELDQALELKWNRNTANNVIVFIGDGLGPNMVTATRIYKGGEGHILEFEKFPHVGLLKIGYMIMIIFTGFSLGAGDDENDEAGLIMGFAFLLVLIFFYAFAIVLLVGLHQDKPGHVKAYLIFGTVFAVLTVFYAVINVAVGKSGIVQEIISLLLNIYFLLVIRSHYCNMKDVSRESAISNTA